MVEYWLDSNVFIEGKKGPYSFDIAPRFWALIDELIDDRRISCPIRVYDELLEGQDDLSDWARARRPSGLFLEPTPAVQHAFTIIIAYVMDTYPDNQARRRFLNRADPWVIAQAFVLGGSVVTLESRVSNNSQQVRIPNVSQHFNVAGVNTYQMLRELGASWGS